ncbi:endonuclease/exonuclease/phosphatase family protein [Rhodobacteraceae bacterium KMM 6894]|nr:endonuclease/exonuclease/phosphatase family protein [Rhodobacteraceae bacterium KMM 6894]
MTEVTLASWNIRAGLGRDLKRRPHRTIDVIAGLDADITILQEADFRRHPRASALPTLHGRIGPMEVVDLTPEIAGLGWHGIAMLTRPGVHVHKIRRFDLPALEPRGAVIVDLDIAGQLLRVVGVHLGLLRGNRRKQIAFVAEQLHALDPMPTIIAGDFNEWHHTKGFETLPDWLSTHSPGPTFPAGRPLLRLDKMAISPEITLLDSAVVTGHGAQIASDHRPIRARFSVASGPSCPIVEGR